MSGARLRLIALTAVVVLLAAAGAAFAVYRLRRPAPPPPPPPVARPAPRPTEAQSNLPAGATFAVFLTQAFQVAPAQAAAIVAAAKPVYNLAHIRAGNPVTVVRDPSGALSAVRYRIDSGRRLVLTLHGNLERPRAEQAPVAGQGHRSPAAAVTPSESHAGGGQTTGGPAASDGIWVAAIEPIAYQIRIEAVSATVQDSLFTAIESVGEQDGLAFQLAQIFGWDLDFYTDTQSGDLVRAVVEKRYLAGRFAGYGNVLAAEYINNGTPYEAVRFHDAAGLPAYYKPNGQPLKREFLRSPLKFAARVTSGFSYHRFHPILKIYRPHLGVDYAAPMGAPVQTIGSGTVISAGWHGGGGREVKIRHANGYDTLYLHLSRILVHRGERVVQGQRIGLVGMSGLATGPHLDFRIEHNGHFENFQVLRRKLPPAAPVAASARAAFASLRQHWLGTLEALAPGTHVVMAQNAAPPAVKTATGR